MSLDVKMREKLFWTYDKFTDSIIYKAYQELSKYDSMDCNSTELVKHQDEALRKLLYHTVSTSDYYRSTTAELSLEAFPVVNKNLIRSNHKKFLSKLFDNKKLYRMSTSGSTGVPFVCFQDKNKKRRVNAEVIYYSSKVGYSIGKNIIVLRALIDQNIKSKLDQWLQNIIQINVAKLDDTSVNKLLAEIENVSKSGSLLVAYASTFDVLKDYFSRKGANHKYNIFGLVSISEILFDDTRTSMMEAFNCKCVSRYSNQENGILGQDETKNNCFNLNEAHYLFEVLKKGSDQPVKTGETGRIVVTDLYNYAMPMIRYDTGDIGAFDFLEQQGIRKKVITNFGGRQIDMVYDCYGNLLSPHKISVAFWKYPELKQFQFVQVGEKDYLIYLNVREAFKRQNELERNLISLLGEMADLKIVYKDDMPVLDSGKRKYIQNNTLKVE